MAGDQIRHHDPPMFHLMVSKNPGEKIAKRCDWSGARGTFAWSLENIPPILRSKVQSTDLDS
jgi:hypothetical protein